MTRSGLDLNNQHWRPIFSSISASLPLSQSVFGELQVLCAMLALMPSDGQDRLMTRETPDSATDPTINPNVRDTFQIRAQIIRYVCRYLDGARLLEVETPMMNMVPGALPPRFHHEAQQPFEPADVLRVAPELYLKMLVVGG
jgi:lysyl-tRNA synthetase class 2